MSLEFIPLRKLRVSKCNVRQIVREDDIRRLMESIERHGLLNPLTVRPEGKYYGIICGRLRYEAIRRLRREKPATYRKLFSQGIPCIVRDLDDREAVLLSLTENVQQHSMSDEELATAIGRLEVEFGLSIDDISRELSLVSSEVERLIRLYRSITKAPPKVPELPKAGRPPKKLKERELSASARIEVQKLAEELAKEGAIPEERVEDVTKELTEELRGLSTGEVRLVKREVRKRADVIRRKGVEGIKEIVEEVKRADFRERQVLIRGDLLNALEDIRRKTGKTFDEVLNEVLEVGLKHYKVP